MLPASNVPREAAPEDVLDAEWEPVRVGNERMDHGAVYLPMVVRTVVA